MNNYWKAKAYAIAMVLLIVGGLNWGVKSFMGKDLISYLTGKNVLLANLLFGAVGVAALLIGLHRDSYLPFLGKTLVPCEVLKAQTPENADMSVDVLVDPGTKVLYWASEPANKDLHGINDWRHAYLAYRNAGVVVADNSGVATLKVRKPQPYTVPIKGELTPHIHYRTCMGEGMLSRVVTVTLDAKEFFENYVNMQETHDPVTEKSAFNYVNPSTALEEVKDVTAKTHNNSLMIQSGAPDEGNLTSGTPIDNEFMAMPTPLQGASLDAAFTGKGV